MKRFPDDAHQRFIEASHLWKQEGKAMTAMMKLRGLLEDYPDYADAWFVLGTILSGPGLRDEQIDAFRKAAENEPDNADFWEALGMSLIAKGSFSESREALKRAHQLDSTSIETTIQGLTAVTSSPPVHPYFWYGKGMVLGIIGREREAKEAMQVSFEENIHVTLFMDGQTEEAHSIATQIVELDPENSGGWLILGNCLVKTRKWAEAESAFKRALEIEPDYPHAWLGLAVALLNQERFDEAEEARRKADMFSYGVEP